MKNLNSIADHFDLLAEKYEMYTKKFGWISPDIVFGLMYEYVKPDQKLLDIGCGTGLSSKPFFKAGLEVHGIDVSEKMLGIYKRKGIAKGLKLINPENQNIPYPDCFFENVISIAVFSFLKDIEPIIAETARVLKKNGICGFTIEEPQNKEIISKDVYEKTGVKSYKHGLARTKKLLNKYDFKVLKTLHFHAYRSLETGKDIYFTAIVIRKINERRWEK